MELCKTLPIVLALTLGCDRAEEIVEMRGECNKVFIRDYEKDISIVNQIKGCGRAKVEFIVDQTTCEIKGKEGGAIGRFPVYISDPEIDEQDIVFVKKAASYSTGPLNQACQ